MLVSPAKVEDKKFLLLVVEHKEALMRMLKKTGDKFWAGQIKEYIKIQKNLEKKIATHDYTEDDAVLMRVREMDKRWAELHRV